MSEPSYHELVTERAEMLHALQLADGGLSWCKHRHAHREPDEALEEALDAVQRFTRPRGQR